jgi:hypothetical protein
MSDRLLFVLLTIFAISMLVGGLKTGRIWAHYSAYRRDESPVIFWVSAGTWLLFACISAGAAITRS